MNQQEIHSIGQGLKDYKGALVYRQEHGYKMITLTVTIAPNEQSHVTTHAYNIPLSEEAEHLQGIDLYHFPVTDGTLIQLTIESPIDIKEVWYIVNHDDVISYTSLISMIVIRSRESITPIQQQQDDRYQTSNVKGVKNDTSTIK